MKMTGSHYYEIEIRNSPLKISCLLQIKWHIIMFIPLGALYITGTWFSAQIFSNVLIILIICSLSCHLDFYKNWRSCDLMRRKIEAQSCKSLILLTEGIGQSGEDKGHSDWPWKWLGWPKTTPWQIRTSFRLVFPKLCSSFQKCVHKDDKSEHVLSYYLKTITAASI